MESEDNPAGDPEIEALLDFEPVPRKLERENGWSAENQRGFIAGLVKTGNYRISAQAMALTASGVYQLRKDAGAEDFSRAWDEAILLHKARNPRARVSARPGQAGGTPAPPPEPAFDAAEEAEFWTGLIAKYQRKLSEERRCRLDGRVVAADFCVRQLTWMEVVLDLGGKAMEVMETLKRGDSGALALVATPISLLLGDLRRHFWLEKGEADRPPPPPLGLHDAAASTGDRSWYNSARDGDYAEWCRRQREARALAAEAQRVWEEKAQAEAEAWAARERGEGPDAPEPEARP